MTINIDLYRNANRNNQLNGYYPLGDAPAQVAGTNAERLFYTTARAAQITTNTAANSRVYDYFISKLEYYMALDPYAAGELSAAFGLGYLITGDTRYRDRAHEVYAGTFNVDGVSGGWADYQGRNQFRGDGLHACMYLSYVGDTLDTTTKDEIISNLEIWANYWVNYIDYDNSFAGFSSIDTDELTALSGHLTALGTVLAQNGSSVGTTTLQAVDAFSSQLLFGYLLDDIYAGGMWGEGRDYAYGTMYHVVHQFLVNKEQRGIDYDSSYIDNMIAATIHNTLPQFTTLNPYGSIQAADSDYIDLANKDAGRFYNCVAQLAGASTDSTHIDLAHYWLNQARTINGGATGSYSGIWHLLFEDPTNAGQSPQALGIDTQFYAAGTRHWAVRSGWTDNATTVHFGADSYLHSGGTYIDHKQKDTLSFNLARAGVFVSKEVSGYGTDGNGSVVNAVDSICHNTLLIENADTFNGSAPTGRVHGQSVVTNNYNSATLGYIAADAKNAYNMSGYYATEYASLVSRQIAFIKPDLLVVYDHTITDPNIVTDLDQYQGNDGSPVTRSVELVQHFNVVPSLAGGYYSAAEGGQEIAFKPVLPTAANVTIADEGAEFSTSSTGVITAFQRKHHLKVQAPSLAADNEFLSVLAVGATGSVVKPVSEQIISAGANAICLLIDYDNEWHCIVFPKDPNAALTNVAFDISASIDARAVNYYVTGLADVTHTISNTAGNVSITQGAGTAATNSVLEF